MPPIGETLREARMRRKLDIADVEERTKIRAKYLRALENEEWGLLPGPTFVKTFLRTYAEVVGLDPHLLVEEYRTQHEAQEEQPEIPPISATRARREPRRRQYRTPGPPRGPVLIAGIFVVVVAFLLVLGLTGGDEDGGGGDATEAARTETAPRRPVPEKPAPKPKPPPGVTVRIAPTVPTYACLDTGDGTDNVFEGILDQPRSFRNARELRINLGKRSVALRANGKTVRIEPSAEPYGLRVTRTGATEITEGPRPCA